MQKNKGISKRQIARDIKNHKEIYVNKFLVKRHNIESASASTFLESEADTNIFDSIDFSHSNYNSALPIKEKIKNWYIKFNPSRKSADYILNILKDENLDVPVSCKSLVKNSEKIILRTVSPGQYWHYGIENQLKKISHIISEITEVIIDINIDGLPLFKSSNQTLWPILGKIVNKQNIKVFLIGTYLGSKKPNSIENYLHDFILEAKNLSENGLNINNKKILFKIRAFIFDAPAKSFVCGIVGHTSLRGCTKCVQTGKKINNTVVYETKTATAISDQDFLERKYSFFHQNYFQSRKTPLEEIGIKMISQIAIDPMHLIDLGVAKKFLHRLLQNKVGDCYKISEEVKLNISDNLTSLYHFIPQEFTRKPRNITEIKHWKAVEYRQFVLYTGIVVLKNKVHGDVFYVFLLLHCAYRLLSCPKSYSANISTAKDLLECFVENFPRIFGNDSVTYNVHHLLHLTDSVKDFGIITNFSAYCFENELQNLKKKIKKPSKILQQLFNKLKYENLLESNKPQGFRIFNNKIISYSSDNLFLSIKEPNNYCCIAPYIPIQVVNFHQDRNGKKFVIGKRLTDVEDFFVDPVPSKISLGISIANLNINVVEEIFDIENIICKLVRLPYENKSILLPILHNCN